MNIQKTISNKIIQSNSNHIKNESKKSRKKDKKSEKKLVPVLKRPSKWRNSSKKDNTNISSKIIWDNKTIEKHYLERINHPRNKINEIKTLYPHGDDEDLYEKGINKVNGIKVLEELLNNSNDLDKVNKEEKNWDMNDLNIIVSGNKSDNDLNYETKEIEIILHNTLINKFHKELRKRSEEKNLSI